MQKDNAEHDSKEEVNKESLDAELEDFFQIEVVDPYPSISFGHSNVTRQRKIWKTWICPAHN